MENLNNMEPIIVGISVLLVFLTFLLHGVTARVEELIKKPKFENKKKETDELNKQLSFVFCCQSLPVTFIYLTVFWVILPRTWMIMTTYEFRLWGFDELSTLYVLMDIGLLGMFLFAANKSRQALSKWIAKRK